ncbi:hypothetical protein EBT25_01865, partial [bacterium]|nr:hypothetical protein [bacterium]
QLLSTQDAWQGHSWLAIRLDSPDYELAVLSVQPSRKARQRYSILVGFAQKPIYELTLCAAYTVTGHIRDIVVQGPWKAPSSETSSSEPEDTLHI